jgi:hypothetical protein
MPGHFLEFVNRGNSPGLILVPRTVSISETIEGLLVAS